MASQTKYDVIVVGAGAMGSAAAWRLAKRGVRVLAIDRFSPPHAHGSSHGSTRLIRQAYFEHPDYVPLLRRAYDLWAELEHESNDHPIFERCGLVLCSAVDDPVAIGTRRSAAMHGISIHETSPGPASRALPQFSVPQMFGAIEEPGAGFLHVAPAVDAQLKLAHRFGAELLPDTVVTNWSLPKSGGPISVVTNRGEFLCDRLVLTAGAWMGPLLGTQSPALKVRRVPLFWFKSPPNMMLGSPNMRCFAFVTERGFFYGFPGLPDEGLKIALHLPGDEVSDPLHVDRSVHAADIEPVQWFIKKFAPDVDPNPIRSSICMYTMTKDEHFVVDHHPASGRVVFASACSGHGFKFAPVIGEMVAAMTLGEGTYRPGEFLRLGSRNL